VYLCTFVSRILFLHKQVWYTRGALHQWLDPPLWSSAWLLLQSATLPTMQISMPWIDLQIQDLPYLFGDDDENYQEQGTGGAATSQGICTCPHKARPECKVRHETPNCLCDTDMHGLSHRMCFISMQSSTLCIQYDSSLKLGSFLTMASRDVLYIELNAWKHWQLLYQMVICYSKGPADSNTQPDVIHAVASGANKTAPTQAAAHNSKASASRLSAKPRKMSQKRLGGGRWAHHTWPQVLQLHAYVDWSSFLLSASSLHL